MLPTRHSLYKKRHVQTESEGMEKIYFMHIIMKRKLQTKIDFITKTVRNDIEEHHMIIKK